MGLGPWAVSAESRETEMQAQKTYMHHDRQILENSTSTYPTGLPDEAETVGGVSSSSLFVVWGFAPVFRVTEIYGLEKPWMN